MNTGRAGFLRNAADIVFHLFAGHHHQIGQLINHDGNIRKVFHAGILLGKTVVALDVTDVVLGKELVAALHLGHARAEGAGRLARLGDNGHEQMRDAVIFGEFHDLGVDKDKLYILRRGAEQETDDNRVDAHGFTAAGRAGNQQVGHLAEVRYLSRSGDVLAQRHGKRAAHIDVILGLKDAADADGRADFVGHLNAHGRFAGNRRFDTDARRGKIQGNIISQAGNAADLNARLRLKFVPCDGRAAADVQDSCFNAETVQRIDKDIGVFLHFFCCAGFILRRSGIEQVERRIAVGLDFLLFCLCGKGGAGFLAHFCGIWRGGNRRQSRVADFIIHLKDSGSFFLCRCRPGNSRSGRGHRNSRTAGQEVRYRNTRIPGSAGRVKVLCCVKTSAESRDWCSSRLSGCLCRRRRCERNRKICLKRFCGRRRRFRLHDERRLKGVVLFG